ncbi:MAG: GNAT family N-acetyltransferase [Pseudomonadota bacterium]
MPRVLTTDRLILRGTLRDDAGLIDTLLSDADVRRFLGGPVPLAQRAGRVAEYLRAGAEETVWIVQTKAPGRAIGLVSLSEHHDGPDTELSYQFHPDTWDQGYATEAARKLLDFALEDLGHDRIIAETQVANAASRRLLARLGMAEVRRLTRFGAAQVIYST